VRAEEALPVRAGWRARGRLPTSGLLRVGLVAGVVLLLATVAVAFGATDTLDARLLGVLGAPRGSQIAQIALGITSLGDTLPLVTLLVVAGVVAPMRSSGGWRVLLLPIVATGVGQLLSDLLKLAVARPRPPAHLWTGSASGFAFPSGHATSSMAGFLTLAIVVALGLPAGRWRVLAVASGIVVAVLVGISRVVLSVHWASDVIGGWALGVIVAVAVVALAGRTSTTAETTAP
jgi:membrane-associated phospholipid phosphatase